MGLLKLLKSRREKEAVWSLREILIMKIEGMELECCASNGRRLGGLVLGDCEIYYYKPS